MNIAYAHEVLKDGAFAATAIHEAAATSIFDTLAFWTERNASLLVRPAH